MSRSRWERLAPLTGAVFFALIAAVFVLDNNSPDANDSTASVVSYWTTHHSRAVVAGLLGSLAVVFLIWFASSLRSAMLRYEGGTGRLSMLAFSGTLLVAFGGAIGSSLDFVLGDVSVDLHNGHADFVIQTLSALDGDFFLPFVGGLLVLMVSSAVLTFRHGALPKWLGWVSVVIAIALVTPLGFIGFLASLVWILVVSILLYLRQDSEPTPATVTAEAP
jgi:hypothetical protein